MKGTISVLAVAGTLMLAGCGGGSKTATMSGGPAVGGETPTPTPTPTPRSVAIEGLPTGHTLETGTIRAGQSRTVGEAGGVTTLVRCSGSEDCNVMVASDGTATLTSGSLRVETQRALITLVPPTPTPTPIPGVGTPGGGTTPITWEQLPSLVDRMDHEESVNKEDTYPVPLQCSSLTDCQSVAKILLAAATEPTGTRRRFQGTSTL